MTNKKVSYRAIIRQTAKKLTDYHPVWEVAAPRLAGQMRTAFGPVDTQANSLRPEAEIKALVAEHRRARRRVAGETAAGS